MGIFFVRWSRGVLTVLLRWGGGVISVRRKIPSGIRAVRGLSGWLCKLGVRLLLRIFMRTR